ncbi:hypothetical protein P4679_23770 [Priestia megaterium]|uniref:hypothetical protein n=1 Tax=Priestia megaterium TaxID=1404 RepID=UPI002E21CEFF|nr:hypothetical protein [Priestia megaterium]
MQHLAIYQPYSDTIRKVPQNYCLICWDGENKPTFDLDGATKQYRDKVKKAYKVWIESVSNNKEDLAQCVHLELSN